MSISARSFGAWRSLATALFRPYIHRELPAWGRVFRLAIGDHRREWLWRGQIRSIVDKRTGYKLDLDLGWWSDRMAFFLGRWYDLQAQLIVDQHIKPGDVVVDVGANRGMFALYAANKVGSAGRVVCFEPNPTCLATLNHTIRANGISNIEVRNAGLSDREEILNLMVPACDTGIGTFAGYGKAMNDTAVPCRVLVGDNALGDVKPDFIKVDVEGFEPRVIRGLAGTLTNHHPLVYMELVPDHLARAGFSAKDLIAEMATIGYCGKRVSYQSRRSTECSYEELSEPIRDCDVLWMPIGHVPPLQ